MFRGVKRPAHEANHSPQSSDEVKHERNWTSTVPIHLYGMEMDNFYSSAWWWILFLVSVHGDKPDNLRDFPH